MGPHFARIFLFCAALLLITAPRVSQAQTTSPTIDSLFKDIDAAQLEFKSAVTNPADLSDPAARSTLAPKAIPPLKRMVSDYQQLADLEPRLTRRSWQIAQQFNAYLSVLGDPQTLTTLQKNTTNPDPQISLNARASQLLASWITANKNQTTQSSLATQTLTLDQANPTSEPLTFLTVTLSQSTQSPTLKQALLQQAKAMQNPLAQNLRRLTPTTRP